MPKATHPVSIDGIEFDALLDESTSRSSDIPDYPTEAGFMVGDTITLHPVELSLTLMVSNTPVTWAERFGGANPARVREVLDRLESCWKKRQLITVLTHDKSYSNMGITSYSEARKGSNREISMSLKEVRTTQTKMVSIPAGYGKSGSTGKKAGKAASSAVPQHGKSDAYKAGFALFAGGG